MNDTVLARSLLFLVPASIGVLSGRALSRAWIDTPTDTTARENAAGRLLRLVGVIVAIIVSVLLYELTSYPIYNGSAMHRPMMAVALSLLGSAWSLGCVVSLSTAVLRGGGKAWFGRTGAIIAITFVLAALPWPIVTLGELVAERVFGIRFFTR